MTLNFPQWVILSFYSGTNDLQPLKHSETYSLAKGVSTFEPIMNTYKYNQCHINKILLKMSSPYSEDHAELKFG